MGASQSYQEIPAKRVGGVKGDPMSFYAPPGTRRALREKPDWTPPDGPVDAMIDPTADKYDYLIVFKKSAQNKVVEIDPKTGHYKVQHASGEGFGLFGNGVPAAMDEDSLKRVYWAEVPPFKDGLVASDVWYDSCMGEADHRLAQVELLKQAWKDSTRQAKLPADSSVSMGQFLNITRDLILGQLMKKTGLQFKMTSRKKMVESEGSDVCCSCSCSALTCGCCGDSSGEGDEPEGPPGVIVEYIYCRIRAPLSLLEKKADLMDYRLQFKPEVDPGMEFWTMENAKKVMEELAEEETLVETKDAANEQLENMYEKKQIAPHDMSVFDDESTPKHWTRRIRTLERIADRVPVVNPYPAYGEFDANPRERHLYMEYPSVRGKTLFLPKDRLYLTRVMIDEVFDFDVLKRFGVVEQIFPLHDASYGERVTRDTFTKSWLFPWLAPNAKSCGGPKVSHPASGDNVQCPWNLRAWAQPFADIREYFGESVALYFAWLGFYSYSLVTPSILGAVLWVYESYVDTDIDGQGISYGLVLYAIGIVCWATYYKESWEVEQKVCAVKWGTRGFEATECDRPQFHGDVMEENWFVNVLFGCPAKPEEPRRLSEVSFTEETYYPEEKRGIKQALNTCSIFFMVIGVLLCNLVLLFLDYYLTEEMGLSWGAYVAVLLAAIQIQILNGYFSPWVEEVNDWENHQTDTAFEDAKIQKTFLFQMFNNYGYVILTAYVKDIMFGCYNADCITDIQTALVGIFFVRYITWFIETIGDPITVLSSMCGCGGAEDEAEKQVEDAAEYEADIAMDEQQAVLLVYYNSSKEVFKLMCSGEGGMEEVDDEAGLKGLGYEIVEPSNVAQFQHLQQYSSPASAVKVLVTFSAKGANSFVPINSTIDDVLIEPEDPEDKKEKLGELFNFNTAVFSHEAVILVCDRARDTAKKQGYLSEMERFEYEVVLEETEGMFNEYASVVLQMGYVALFSIAWGWLPFIALIETLLQIRGDAYAYVRTAQRPQPAPQEDVGAWGDLMGLMIYLAIFSNTAIIVFSTHALHGYSFDAHIMYWLVLEHLVLAIKLWFSNLMPSDPEVPMGTKGERSAPLSQIIARNDFIVEKHKKLQIVEEIDMESGGGSNLDADDLNLSDMKASVPLKTRAQIEFLKKKLRFTDRRVDELRRSLKSASEGEVWNAETGVAEAKSKPGLALGLVNLKIIKLEGLEPKGARLMSPSFMVVVSVRDQTKYDGKCPYEGGPDKVGPPPVCSRPGSTETKNGKKFTVFNQVRPRLLEKRSHTCVLYIYFFFLFEAEMMNIFSRAASPCLPSLPSTGI
jgi:hypothetical protein